MKKRELSKLGLPISLAKVSVLSILTFVIEDSPVWNRRQPSLEVLFEIAKILEVNAKDLLKEDLND